MDQCLTPHSVAAPRYFQEQLTYPGSQTPKASETPPHADLGNAASRNSVTIISAGIVARCTMRARAREGETLATRRVDVSPRQVRAT